MGCIDMPFTALGVTWDGRRFSWCSPSCVNKWIPAAEISAPESGRASTTVDLLRDVKLIVTEGARLMMAATFMFDMRTLVLLSLGGLAWCACLSWQTLAKWPVFWHKQVWLYAGHCLRQPGCWLGPQPWHTGTVMLLFRWALLRLCTVSEAWLRLVISTRCFLTASCAWHLEMAVDSCESFSCRRVSMMSGSWRPSIIWSRMFFSRHVLLQNLHVFASSRSDTN